MAIYYNPSIVTNGLVLYLDAGNVKSYSGAGTTWTDLTELGNNGTLTNGPTFNTSNLGSFVFDGSDDYIDTSQSFTSNQFTYEVVLKPTNVSKDQMYIGAIVDAFYIRITGSKAFLSVSTSGGQRTMTHDSVLQNNEIYHIVSIYNGVQLKIYVNNVLTSGTVLNETLSRWGGNRIGRWRDIDQRSFVGNIYIIRGYNRELSAEQIFQNFVALRGRFGL